MYNRELYRRVIVGENGKTVTEVAYINAGAPGKEKNNRIMIEHLGPSEEVQRMEIIYKDTEEQRFDKILADIKEENNPTT